MAERDSIEVQVLRLVKEFEFAACRRPWRELKDTPVQSLRGEFAPEGLVPVGAERMTVAKAVAGDPLACDDTGVRSAVFSHAMPPQSGKAVRD